MARMNWSKAVDRDRMRLQGTEGARDDVPFMAPVLKARGPWRRPPSKADLRATAAEALARFA
jgi:hypothetical protein